MNYNNELSNIELFTKKFKMSNMNLPRTKTTKCFRLDNYSCNVSAYIHYSNLITIVMYTYNNFKAKGLLTTTLLP